MAGRDKITRTPRESAEETQLSLGVVNRYLSQLEAAGFVKDHEFVDYKKLLAYWLADFDRYFLPKLEKTRFSPTKGETLDNLKGRTKPFKQCFWSGAKAVDVLLGTEVPSQFIIYTQNPKGLIVDLRLKPDSKGPIGVRNKFWTFELEQEIEGIAPLPLVYADLILSKDPCDHKAAKKIEEKIQSLNLLTLGTME